MEGTETSNKVIFTSLGPDRCYTDLKGTSYCDGDVALLCPNDYDRAVEGAKFAQDWSPDLEFRIKKLVQSAKETRARILAKVAQN